MTPRSLARVRRPSIAAVIAALVLGASTARADERAQATQAAAEGQPAVLLPTALLDGGERRVARADDRELLVLIGRLDALLTDTAQDLGLSLDLTARAGEAVAPADEIDLAARAQATSGAVIAPSLAVDGRHLELRLVLARPGSRTLHMRVEKVPPSELELRAAIMLRDLLRDAEAQPATSRALAPGAGASSGTLATPARSAGRATLAVNATLYGGFVGYSLLRSSGSDDPRLLYPLLAVGAGVGLGGSIIAAEEWDVGTGDAWFLASGVWWPALAGHLIYEGRFSEHGGASDERWAFGLVGGAAGLTVATLGLSLRGMSDGGAVVAHSGGGLGLVLGGLAELSVRGDIDRTPFAGMGYGAGFGWLAAAALATQIHVPPARVLALDLGALLGGLGGAALASPLVFDAPSALQQRAWLGATGGATLAGAGIAWVLARDPARASAAASVAQRLPRVGVVGESALGSVRVPVYGATWSGAF